MTPRILSATATLLTVAALMLSGCTTTDQDENSAEHEQAIGLSVDASRVTLLTPGSDATTVFAYQLADTHSTRSVNIGYGFNQEVLRADAVDPTAPSGTTAQTTTLPLTLSGQLAPEPGEGEAAADFQASLELGAANSTETSDNEDLASVTGFRVTERLNATGQSSTIGFAAPVAATDEGRAAAEEALMKLLALPVIFPTEPIGPGAVWTVDSRVTGEATMLRTTTYTLDSFQGTTAALQVSISERPAQGALDLSGLASPTTTEAATPSTLTVLSTTTTTHGTLSVDLTSPLPLSGTVAWTTRVVYGDNSSAVRVVQDSTTDLSFS